MNSGCNIPSGYLPPIKPPKDPLLSVFEIIAIDRVILPCTKDVIPVLERFYVDIFGFKTIAKSLGDGLLLRWERQDLLISPDKPIDKNGIIICIYQFGRSLQILDELKIPYDIITQEVGRSRIALLYDPAGNLVKLLEHRPL